MLAAAALVVALPASAGARTVYTLTGHGWGHGIGMSQYGALGYALHGYSYGQILTHYFSHTRLAPVSQGVSERVLMESGRTAVDVASAGQITIVDEATGAKTSIPAGEYRVRYGTTPGKLQVASRVSGATVVPQLTGPVRVLPTTDPLRLDDATGMGWSGDHWNGWFRVIPDSARKRLDCVNVVPMEHYLRGVVPAEVPSSWPTAALRTQAVASRSYAYATRNPGGEYDAFSDTRSQAYSPIEHEATSTDAAVRDTRYRVVWYGGSIATTFFSSSSGGRTSSEQASWGSSSGEPYLVPVSDPFDRAMGRNPNHTWAPRAYTATGLARLFGYTSPVGSIDETIDPASRRELTLTLHTAAADRVLSGPAAQIRAGLRSTYFRVLQTTLKVSSHAIRRGTSIIVSGRVWPRPSSRVSLLRRSSASTAWTVSVDHLPLTADGRFAVRLRPSSNRQYRLLLRTGAISPVVSVQVAG